MSISLLSVCVCCVGMFVVLFFFTLATNYIVHTNVDKGPVDEKEVLLRHAYGLGYPEPNVTFALCRGTWSSPAVSVLLYKLT